MPIRRTPECGRSRLFDRSRSPAAKRAAAADGPPAAFTPLGCQRALLCRRRDRRLALARGEDARRQDPPAQRRRGAGVHGRSRPRAAPADRRHRPRRAAGRRRDRHPHPGRVHVRRRKRGREAAVRRDPARDRADGEDAQPDLCRRARPHRHHPARRRATRRCRRSAPRRSRPISPAMASRKARIASHGSRRNRAALQSRDTRNREGGAIAGSRSGSCPTPASAARAKKPRSSSAASSSPIPPSTSGRWWQVGWAKMRAPWTTPPPFGSSAREAQRLRSARPRRPRRTSRRARASPTRCNRRAADVPSFAAAARIATISAWAVGSFEPRIALRLSAMISSPSVTTAPTGTSPASRRLGGKVERSAHRRREAGSVMRMRG